MANLASRKDLAASLGCPERECRREPLCITECALSKHVRIKKAEHRAHPEGIAAKASLAAANEASVPIKRTVGEAAQAMADSIRRERASAIPPAPKRLLGSQSAIPQYPDEAEIECVSNPHPDTHYVARFTCPEFTSLCPVTGQPDFAHIVIDYVPGDLLIESKALKLFLFSFRNHGAFHEDCTVGIGKRLRQACHPVWFRIAAYWYPRGGIPIDVFWEHGELPEGVNSPPDYVPSYRGRG
jgi:7-cyano-7-deazaguanine reductase